MTTLTTIFVHKGEFSHTFLRNVVDFLSFENCAPLVSYCKEMSDAEQFVLFNAPKRWLNKRTWDRRYTNSKGKLLVGPGTGPLHILKALQQTKTTTLTRSRWVSRIDTSQVEHIMLGLAADEENQRTCHESDRKQFGAVTRQWLAMLGNHEIFPRLFSLDLSFCFDYGPDPMIWEANNWAWSGLRVLKITNVEYFDDLDLKKVSIRCPHLVSLDLLYCMPHVTNAGIKAIASKCKHLQFINLTGTLVNDAGVMNLAKGCPHLKSIKLEGCGVCDFSLEQLGKYCHHLQSIDVSCCRITDQGVIKLVQGCPHLQSLNLRTRTPLYQREPNEDITDVSMMEVGRCCSFLKLLNVEGCPGITDVGVAAVVKGCPHINMKEFKFGHGTHDSTDPEDY